MADVGLSGCNWVRLKRGTYQSKNEKLESNCQIEVDIDWENLEILPDDKWDSIAPYRILSYDIECSGRKGIFPEATIDQVIQIANTITIYGHEDQTIKVVFTLGSCAPIVGACVMPYKTEKEMLRGWARFIIDVDPDIITGYNIFNFDTPYLIDRANHLGVTEVLHIGRIKSEASRVRSTTFQNRAFGRRDNKSVNISGRLQLDVYQILLREHKLRSYTLNNVSFHFLGEQKEDVAYSIITDLQNGDEYSRRRLAVYCLKDSYLPIRLLDKLMIITNHVEMSRVTGVPLNFLITRGQQVKVISQLIRACKVENLLIPTVNPSSGEEFEGATVIEPVKGYYDDPIATLDFVSLYPSIMICHNLCYSTLLNPRQAKSMNEDDYTVTPCGNYFVKQHIRKGILPRILQNLLDARKQVKILLKTEQNPLKRKVYDGRQLAIKLSANSVYGFTGAQVGRLPCLEISGSVTAFGRAMIEQTKNVVENKYHTKNGYNFNARVIYGDTDSVMVKFGTPDIQEAMTLAKEAAKYVSSQFPEPIKLEFEKVYLPYLLINKKRYAGLLYTNPKKYDRIDCKGIETVRRDNCLLVANLVSSCLYKILIERDPNGAVKHACQTISDLLMNKIDISLLIITKELRKTGEDYANKQPHSELAERLKKRDPGSAPKLGDRVPFVYIMGQKKDRAYEKAEDPLYVLENNIPIDNDYYLVNQLSKPLTRLFDPILHEKTEDILLKGEHTRTRSVTVSSVGLLAKFSQAKKSCLGCKSSIDKNGENKPLSDALCSYCDENFICILSNEMNKMNSFQDKCDSLWTECQRCQGSFVEEVICTK
ncbi:DNA polymerase delta catalytic subunit [Thelohanellus kitauei]|uniref:DNA polymerase n=1 Tax=Thelohanellus kitauei TaxID=669202 RepID=A0A0C2N683_THEKT|nr:DNA polymerase delta catalytic subunit [Thelohanellus kitauei]